MSLFGPAITLQYIMFPMRDNRACAMIAEYVVGLSMGSGTVESNVEA